jgi:hypothetical protein
MQGFADTFILVIPLEDNQLHTNEHPFCFDPNCPFKEDQELIAQVAQQVQDGLFTPQEATNFVSGKTV